MSFQVPSIYWPIAEMGFSRNKNLRGVFHLLFCRLYRKRFWNPLINSWAKNKGFDHRRHLLASNTHAACSALVLMLIMFYLYFAHRAALSGLFDAQRRCYVWAVAWAIFELIYNAPAVVLTRYLYLLTRRRPGLTMRATTNVCPAPGA
ncbi:MAG TPA: hypothetical protein VL171_06745 [Verrucomicrobiae bacterium]|nr:hypothetical protein [Verrucomicrobiae bacterium]